jgi:hypothetical protein
MDSESVAGHLLAEGSVFAFLAAHRQDLFPDAMFADLFASGRGRPSVPAPVVATVLVLQALQGFSDREAAEAVRFDLRWKAACGLPVTAGAFHSTTLTYWRARLAASDSPNRIFEVVRAVVAQTGAVRGKNRRVLDSTVLDDAVATQDTITQLIAAVRRVARVLPGGGELVAAAAISSGHDYTRAGKPRIAWDDEVARAELVDGLVRDALGVLAAIAAAEDAGDLRLEGPAAEAVGLLGLVAGQDVEFIADPADPAGEGSWRIARNVAPDRVISTVDPDSRHAHKTTSRRQEGFKAHLVVEPDTGLITACGVTKASGEGCGDAVAGIELLAADSTLPRHAGHAQDVEDAHGVQAGGAPDPVEVLGDSAYGSGDMLAALATAGHVALVKPWPVNAAVPGGFTVDDFTVDEARGTMTCPAGATRPITATRQVNFRSACRACLLRERCTTSRTGKTMRLGEHDALQRAHRVRAGDPDFAATYRRWRPMVERSIAWVTRGNRRLRYRGTAKNNAWLQLRSCAINLRRLLVLGLHHDETGWALS